MISKVASTVWSDLGTRHPLDIYVYVAEPEAIHDIFVRRGDILRPSKMYSKSLEFQVPGLI